MKRNGKRNLQCVVSLKVENDDNKLLCFSTKKLYLHVVSVAVIIMVKKYQIAIRRPNIEKSIMNTL